MDTQGGLGVKRMTAAESEWTDDKMCYNLRCSPLFHTQSKCWFIGQNEMLLCGLQHNSSQKVMWLWHVLNFTWCTIVSSSFILFQFYFLAIQWNTEQNRNLYLLKLFQEAGNILVAAPPTKGRKSPLFICLFVFIWKTTQVIAHSNVSSWGKYAPWGKINK